MIVLSTIVNSVRAAWKALCRSARTLRREYVIEQYLRSGAQFGDALNRLFMGECVALDDIKKRFGNFERRYASLGYRTIPLEEFIEYGAYGRSVHHLLRVTRDLGEPAVFYTDRLDEEHRANGFAPMKEFGSKRDNWLNCGLDKTKTQHCEGRDDCRHAGEGDHKDADDASK
jgi:hypothetical protein